MFIKPSKITFIPILLSMLVALSIPAYPADNATITGDSVRLRAVPAITGDVLTVLNKGTRVEVKVMTNYSDTIDGHTAPWYQVCYGEIYYAFVFGEFIKPDAGMDVPSLEDPIDPIIYFVEIGFYMFGKSESDIIKNLGQPISRAEEKYSNYFNGDSYVLANHTLRYKGIVAEVHEFEDGTRLIHRITFTTNSVSFWGLMVGSSAADVYSVLGAPKLIDGDFLMYYNNSGSLNAGFFIRKGVVTEIVFWSQSQG